MKALAVPLQGEGKISHARPWWFLKLSCSGRDSVDRRGVADSKFARFAAVKPGYDIENVIIMRMPLAGERFQKSAAVERLALDGAAWSRHPPGVVFLFKAAIACHFVCSTRPDRTRPSTMHGRHRHWSQVTFQPIQALFSKGRETDQRVTAFE